MNNFQRYFEPKTKWTIELPEEWDNKTIMDAVRKLVLVGSVDDGAVLLLALDKAKKDEQ